jgi:hypothetical protein
MLLASQAGAEIGSFAVAGQPLRLPAAAIVEA